MTPADTPRTLTEIDAGLARLDARLMPYRSLDPDLVPEALLFEFDRLHMERIRAINREPETAPPGAHPEAAGG